MVLGSKRPVAEIARDLGVHEGTLGNWVNSYRRSNPEPQTALSPTDRARLAELRRTTAGCGWRTSS